MIFLSFKTILIDTHLLLNKKACFESNETRLEEELERQLFR